MSASTMAWFNAVVNTPVTAHSTCSIFPLSPNEARVHFGYNPQLDEYPYNLDFDQLKPANGYASGMLSAPLYPSTLETKESRPSKLNEEFTFDIHEYDNQEVLNDYNTDKEMNYNDKETATQVFIKQETQEPINPLAFDSEKGISSGSSSLMSSNPTTPITSAMSAHNASDPSPPNQKLIYRSPSASPFLGPTPRKSPAICGSYEIYKNSLPFRQLGYASQGKLVTREIPIKPMPELPQLSPSPTPSPELPSHRRPSREPLVPSIIYGLNNEEIYVSRYNYLPYGNQGREPSGNPLEELLAHARSQGFTTATPRYRLERGQPPKFPPGPHFSSRNPFDPVPQGEQHRAPLAPARRAARENLIAALSRRLEEPRQYNVMPNPPFPWMQR